MLAARLPTRDRVRCARCRLRDALTNCARLRPTRGRSRHGGRSSHVRSEPYPRSIPASTSSGTVVELPNYSRPPVVEVALAVQFDADTVDSLVAGTFRAQVRGEFPGYEEQPARPPMEEVFEPQIGGPPFRVEMLSGAPKPRLWFLRDEGARLVQLQHDLIAVNWRDLTGSDDYTRYESLRSEVKQHLATLDKILEEEGRSPVRPNWCEVTYINHVLPEEAEDRPSLERVLTVVSPPSSTRFLRQPEDILVRERFLIEGSDSKPRGRLTLEAIPAFRNEDRVPIWVITLTSRVRAVEEGLEGALEALDLGREWAVRGFDDVTTPEMQSQWGREERGASLEPGR